MNNSSESDNRCPECGAPVAGGRDDCQALWDEIAVRAYSDIRYAAVRDLAFDAYCMQHPERYGRSAKSYAAHLTRLCCGLEHSGDPVVYAAILRWLDGHADIRRPETLAARGQITVADVSAARTGDEHVRLVLDWARSVWAAYATQHDLARNWIRAALTARAQSQRQRLGR